jgi:uncharacterized membrane protein
MLSLRSPVHPIAVHFTIALTTSSFFFDLLGVFRSDRSLAAAGWWALVGAVIATVAALVTGTASRRRVPMGEGMARRYLRLHMALGPMFIGALLLNGFWRWSYWRAAVSPSWLYFVGFGGVLLLLTVQGYLGGELVYDFGVEVRGAYPFLRVTEKDSADERERGIRP